MGASFTEVKTAYRKMILKHHPDKRAEDVTEHEAEKIQGNTTGVRKIKEIMGEK